MERGRERGCDYIPVPNIDMLNEEAHSTVCLYINFSSQVKDWLPTYK